LLFDELVRLEIELWDAVDARLSADCGLPLGRFMTMRAIAGRPDCRVQDIAEELGITVGGTSKVVDRVVAAAHCIRRPNPDDKRSSLIELTPAGAEALAKATTCFEDELERRLGSALPGGDLRELTATLTRLRAAVRAPDGVTARGGKPLAAQSRERPSG
jgi:DNA-binding MarR family transcriptional regulator